MSNRQDAPPQASFVTGTGYLLSQLGRLAERSWVAAIAAVGLAQSEYLVLAVLAENPALTQRDLAFKVGQDPRNTVATVAALTDRGLVAAQRDPADARRKRLSLTAAGRRVMKRLGRSLATGRADFLTPLDERERETLRELLLRVHRQHAASPATVADPD